MAAPRLLIADRDANFCDEARESLETEGYVVVTATDGRAALASATEPAPDLLVANVDLPLLDGWKLVKRIKSMEGCEAMPVLFLSDRSTDTTRRQASRVGIQDVLLKPVHPETLAFRIARMLSARYKVETTARVLRRASGTRRLMRPPPGGDSPAAAPTTEPKTPRTPAVREDVPAFAGSLEHVSLGTVLSVLDVEHKTGRLTMVNGEDGTLAWIEVRSGRLIRARLDDVRGSTNRDAILVALAWEHGGFRFYAEPVEGEDEIDAATTELLLEGARTADESARLEARPAPPPGPATLPEPPADPDAPIALSEVAPPTPLEASAPDPTDDRSASPLELPTTPPAAGAHPGGDPPAPASDDAGPEFV